MNALRMTAFCSSIFAGSVSVGSFARAWRHCSQYPMFTSVEKIFCHEAVNVTATSKARGMNGIHTHFVCPLRTTITVATSRATAAINWLAMPKSG